MYASGEMLSDFSMLEEDKCSVGKQLLYGY
jgi:hypothetical protein